MLTENVHECPIVTTEEVNRLLDVGRLLLSTLTQEELDRLKQFLDTHTMDSLISFLQSSESDDLIGNTSVA